MKSFSSSDDTVASEISLIYNPSQILSVSSVLRSKLIHNQYYAINYLNELSYQCCFNEFVKDGDILRQLTSMVER